MTHCYTIPGLFASKMHAFLFRNWKNRVKGRDWYDLEWYIRNEHKLSFNHLKERCIQSRHIDTSDFTPDKLFILLKERIEKTNIEMVKADVKPFIQNTNDLEIWSTEYFLKLIDFMKLE